MTPVLIVLTSSIVPSLRQRRWCAYAPAAKFPLSTCLWSRTSRRNKNVPVEAKSGDLGIEPPRIILLLHQRGKSGTWTCASMRHHPSRTLLLSSRHLRAQLMCLFVVILL